MTILLLDLTMAIRTITGLMFEIVSFIRIFSSGGYGGQGEKKHGFNNLIMGLFFDDKAKSPFLAMIIGSLFVSLLLKIIH